MCYSMFMVLLFCAANHVPATHFPEPFPQQTSNGFESFSQVLCVAVGIGTQMRQVRMVRSVFKVESNKRVAQIGLYSTN